MKTRCPWPSDDKLMIKYHDKEWGVPLHNDKKLFRQGLAGELFCTKEKIFVKHLTISILIKLQSMTKEK